MRSFERRYIQTSPIRWLAILNYVKIANQRIGLVFIYLLAKLHICYCEKGKATMNSIISIIIFVYFDTKCDSKDNSQSFHY